VLRVYVGSFWDQPLMCDDNAPLFEMEERDLMRDLKDLPRNSAVRKINELVKRVRSSKVHAYIIGHLKEQMPMFLGSAKKQAQLIDGLKDVFKSVLKKYNLAAGDFPDFDDFKSKLREHDFNKFQALKPRMIDEIETVMGTDFPRLMEALPRPDNSVLAAAAAQDASAPLVYDAPRAAAAYGGGGGGGGEDDTNPWGDDGGGSGDGGGGADEWALAEYLPRFQPQFDSVQRNGLVTGGAAKGVLQSTGLQVAQLRKIWELSDLDKDGNLDVQEFTIALFLAEMVKAGHSLPAQLDEAMIPANKRR